MYSSVCVRSGRKPYERFSRDAAHIIIKPLNVLLLKMFYYSMVSSHRAVIADYKVARAKS